MRTVRGIHHMSSGLLFLKRFFFFFCCFGCSSSCNCFLCSVIFFRVFCFDSFLFCCFVCIVRFCCCCCLCFFLLQRGHRQSGGAVGARGGGVVVPEEFRPEGGPIPRLRRRGARGIGDVFHRTRILRRRHRAGSFGCCSVSRSVGRRARCPPSEGRGTVPWLGLAWLPRVRRTRSIWTAVIRWYVVVCVLCDVLCIAVCVVCTVCRL